MAMNRAVLWDMDGTLVDSAEYHWQAWRDTMSRGDSRSPTGNSWPRSDSATTPFSGIGSAKRLLPN